MHRIRVGLWHCRSASRWLAVRCLVMVTLGLVFFVPASAAPPPPAVPASQVPPPPPPPNVLFRQVQVLAAAKAYAEEWAAFYKNAPNAPRDRFANTQLMAFYLDARAAYAAWVQAIEYAITGNAAISESDAQRVTESFGDAVVKAYRFINDARARADIRPSIPPPTVEPFDASALRELVSRYQTGDKDSRPAMITALEALKWSPWGDIAQPKKPSSKGSNGD